MRRGLWAVVLLAGCVVLPTAWSVAVADSSPPIMQGGDDDTDPDDDPPDDDDPRGIVPRPPGESEAYQEFGDRLRSWQQVSPLSSDVFGDSTNLHDGQTTFSNVDVDVPGNGLPLQVRRRLAVTREDASEKIYGGFGNWEIDVPHIVITLPASGPTSDWSNRCSTKFQPTINNAFWLSDVWTGMRVHVPGGIDSELYYLPGSGSSIHPTGDSQTYRWTTSDYSVLRCEGSGTNESFVMITPEGTKYTFDTLISRTLSKLLAPISTSGDTVEQTRKKSYMLASQVEDRHGNKIVYTYSTNGHPLYIRSYPTGSGTADREIQLTYVDTGVNERVSTITAHGRTWTYEYDSFPALLEYVNLPTDSDIPSAAGISCQKFFP